MFVPFQRPGRDKSNTSPPSPRIRTLHQSWLDSVIKPSEPADIVAKARMYAIKRAQKIDSANVNNVTASYCETNPCLCELHHRWYTVLVERYKTKK